MTDKSFLDRWRAPVTDPPREAVEAGRAYVRTRSARRRSQRRAAAAGVAVIVLLGAGVGVANLGNDQPSEKVAAGPGPGDPATSASTDPNEGTPAPGLECGTVPLPAAAVGLKFEMDHPGAVMSPTSSGTEPTVPVRLTNLSGSAVTVPGLKGVEIMVLDEDGAIVSASNPVATGRVLTTLGMGETVEGMGNLPLSRCGSATPHHLGPGRYRVAVVEVVSVGGGPFTRRRGPITELTYE